MQAEKIQVIRDKIQQQPWFADRVSKLARRKASAVNLEESAFTAQAEKEQLSIELNNFIYDSLLQYWLLHPGTQCSCGTCSTCEKTLEEILGKYENFPR